MKAVKTEQSLAAAAAEPAASTSRLSQLRSRGSALIADTKAKAMDIAELVNVKAQSVKVKVSRAVSAGRAQAVKTADGFKQQVMVKVNQISETGQSLKAGVKASYGQLRSQGVKAWASHNLKTLRVIAVSQYNRAMATAAGLLASTMGGLRSRAAALVAGVKSVYTDRLNQTIKALEAAKAKAKDTADKAKTKAIDVSGKAKAVASDRHVQVTAASAAAGSVTMGATGLATGTAVGAVVGIVPALFTFGLSIPIGAAIGGGAGLAVGATAGAMSGGAAGHVAYAKRNDIKDFSDGAIKKASTSVDLMKGKAAASAGYLKGKVSEVRERIVGEKA